MPIDAFIAGLVAVAARGPAAFFAGYALIGVLLVVGAVTSLRWLVAFEQRHLGPVLTRTRTLRRMPVSPGVLVRHPAARPPSAGGLADFLEDPRSRPTYNPDAGPRDW